MHATKNTPDAAATAHGSTWEKNHRYYTALQEETQAPAVDYGLDTYAAPRTIRRETQENRERTWEKYEL